MWFMDGCDEARPPPLASFPSIPLFVISMCMFVGEEIPTGEERESAHESNQMDSMG